MPHYADHIREPLETALRMSLDGSVEWWVHLAPSGTPKEVYQEMGHLWACSDWAPAFAVEAAASWLETHLPAEGDVAYHIRYGVTWAGLVRLLRPRFLAWWHQDQAISLVVDDDAVKRIWRKDAARRGTGLPFDC